MGGCLAGGDGGGFVTARTTGNAQYDGHKAGDGGGHCAGLKGAKAILRLAGMMLVRLEVEATPMFAVTRLRCFALRLTRWRWAASGLQRHSRAWLRLR
mgnify:FL=1